MLLICKKLLKEGGLLFLTLPLSCLVPSSGGGRKARAAPGFDRQTFDKILTDVGFTLLPPPDSKTSEKVAFYCLLRPVGSLEELQINLGSPRKNISAGGHGRFSVEF